MATKLKGTKFETKTAPEKTLEELQNEYTQGCLKAGSIQYQIQALKWDLEELNTNLRSVNIQASQLKAKEAPAATDQVTQ